MIELGKPYEVKFPIGGNQIITPTMFWKKGFKGTNQAGRSVTVRSIKQVVGFEDYVPPEEPVEQLEIGKTVVVSVGRGTREVVIASQEGKNFTDSTGKVWPIGRIRDKMKPRPKMSGLIVGNYSVDWSDSYTIKRADGDLVFKSNSAREILETLLELQNGSSI